MRDAAASNPHGAPLHPSRAHAGKSLHRLLLDPAVNAKAWYVWCFASLVSVGPFLNVFFQGVGLSKAQIGLIGALRPWTSIPASFAWAALADRSGAHRAVLLGTFLAACTARMLLLLPKSFGGLLTVVLLAEVLMAPVSVLADAAVMQICQKESDYGKFRLWGAVGWGAFSTVAGWLISHLGIRWAFYIQAILALPCIFHGWRLYTPRKGSQGHMTGDDDAGPQPRSHRNQQDPHSRNGGSREGSLELEESDPLLPLQADTLDQFRMSHRSGTAGESGRRESASAAAVSKKGHTAVDGAGGGSDMDQGYWRKLWVLVQRSEVRVFFITAIAMGYGFGTIDSFLFLYLEQMGATGTLMGLTLTVTCIAEIPAFQLQDRLLDRWGVTAVLDLTQAVYVLRLALYAALPLMGNVMWVLPVEILHGVTFACGWGAGTVNCKLLAPPGLAATLQGAFQGLYFGAGYGLGSLIGGWLGTRFGWQGMFACASATMLGFWLLVLAARRLVHVQSAGRNIEMASTATV